MLYLNDADRLVRFDGESDEEPHVVYDAQTLGFAVSNDEGLIALLIPIVVSESSPLPSRSRKDSNAPKMEIRVFGLADCWLSTLYCSLVSAKYKFGAWSASGKFLYLYDGDNRVSIFSMSRSEGHVQLKHIVDDRGRHPLCVNGEDCLGLFREREQQVTFWNLESNKEVAQLPLSRRSTKLLHVVSTSCLLVALYDDLSITFTLCKEGQTFIKLQKFDGLFVTTAAAAEGEKDRSSPKRIVAVSASREDSPSTLDVFVGSACSTKVFQFVLEADKIVTLAAESELHTTGHVLRGFMLAGPAVVAASTSGRGKNCVFETLLFESRLEEGKKSKSRNRRKKKQSEPNEELSHSQISPSTAPCNPTVGKNKRTVEPTTNDTTPFKHIPMLLLTGVAIVVVGVVLFRKK